jgi:hypothetical protein
VLFLDEAHMMMGAGSVPGEPIDGFGLDTEMGESRCEPVAPLRRSRAFGSI